MYPFLPHGDKKKKVWRLSDSFATLYLQQSQKNLPCVIRQVPSPALVSACPSGPTTAAPRKRGDSAGNGGAADPVTRGQWHRGVPGDGGGPATSVSICQVPSPSSHATRKMKTRVCQSARALDAGWIFVYLYELLRKLWLNL